MALTYLYRRCWAWGLIIAGVVVINLFSKAVNH